MYATIAQLTSRINTVILANLVNEERTTVVNSLASAQAVLATTAVQDRITSALQDATNMVDAKVQHYLDMTVTENLDMVMSWTVKIAIYYLYNRNGFEDMRNPYTAQYKETMGLLRDLAQGRLHSKATDQQAPARTDFQPDTSTGYTSVFSDDNLTGYVNPPCWTQD